jgi:hypothetical protein
MTKVTGEVHGLIEKCSEEERRLIFQHLRNRLPLHPLEQEWGTTAEAILTAIARSPDLTQRGVRGILAEATFEEFVLPQLRNSGWATVPIVGNTAYDFLVERGGVQARIQVKLQRREAGIPKEYPARARASLSCPPGAMHVVEVQKTRTGKRRGHETRPYRFTDFDILAVNLHPSTGDWKRFLYTVGAWLLPRQQDPALIKIFQPVPICADDFWTDNLEQCIERFLGHERRRLYQ